MREVFLAREEHIPHIAALEKATFTTPWSESSIRMFFDIGGTFTAVCLEDGELASYCTVLIVLDEVQIINVATAEKYKRRGCADAVISLVLEESKRRNIETLSLEVRVSNDPAISLYEKYGFSIAGRRKDFYEKPKEDAFVMIKYLGKE